LVIACLEGNSLGIVMCYRNPFSCGYSNKLSISPFFGVSSEKLNFFSTLLSHNQIMKSANLYICVLASK
jgi:hypothetical protein